MKNLIILIFILFNLKITAQNAGTVKAFSMLSTTKQRIAFLDSAVSTLDKQTFDALLIEIKAQKDDKAAFYWHLMYLDHYAHFKGDKQTYKKNLDEMCLLAKEKGLKAESVIGEIYISNLGFASQKINEEKIYSNYLNCFDQISNLGVDAFSNYNLLQILYEIGRNFNQLGDNEKALEALLLSQKIDKKNTSAHFNTLVLDLIGFIYAEQKNYDAAIAYNQKVYQLNSVFKYNETQSWYGEFWKAMSQLNIAKYLVEMGKTTEGEIYARKGYELYQSQADTSNKDKNLAAFDALNVLIMIKLKLGKLDEVEPLLMQVGLLKQKLDFSNESVYFRPLKLYQNYIQYYEAKKDYTNGYRYIKLSNEMQDSLNRRNDKRKLWQTETRVKIARYQEQLKSIEEDNRWQERLRNMAVIAFLLLAIFGVFIYLYIKKDNKIINEQKALLQQSLVEKETLLKEIHHRVKNNLQIISGLFDKQARLTTDETNKKLMREVQNRVFSIALVHQNLYESENLSTINIRTYLEVLAGNIEKSQKNEHQDIKTFLSSDIAFIDIDTAIPLGLIVNELITNCYKYAFTDRTTGEIHVHFNQDEKKMILTVRDNGIGLPADFNYQKSPSLGMNLVRGLVRQINGKLDIKSSDKGTTFTILCEKK
jgi:two-component sensor histidine kinase